jgi:hypothetical protein
LAENKRELEEKNINIDRINKMLNSRITEITNLYYLIVNISKYIADDRFYSIVVRGIREGLHIRNVIVFENENLEEYAAIWSESNPDWEKEINKELNSKN